MASTHKHLRSSTANKRPTTSIAEGQIALNTNITSPGLFFKDSTGATIIKVGPVHVGTTAPNATPPAGGSSGNSTGEVWLDTSLTPNGVKIWNGSAWVNATPVGSTTVQGLLELATDAETQAGSDTARAVTPASLQSKMSDSATTTSATTIASSTAVKTAYDLANAALPRSGGTVTGNLEIGTTGSLSFEGSVADGFETTIAVTNPTADRTITLPDTTGTVVLDSGAQTVQFGAGSAASPSLTFSGDTNTGIYSPGADQVAISSGGSGRLFINSSGQVAVGSVASTNSAVLVSNGSVTSQSATLSSFNFDNTGFDYTSNNGRFFATATGASGGNMFFVTGNNGSYNERLRITSAGLVGIGTSSVSSLLHLASSGPVLTLQRSDSASPGAAVNFTNNTGGVNWQVGTNQAVGGSAFEINSGNQVNNRFVITSAGLVGIGTSAPSNTAGFGQQVEIAGTLPCLTLNQNNAGFTTRKYSLAVNASGDLGAWDNTASAYRMYINSSGNVGIGTTSPSVALDVNGSGSFKSSILFVDSQTKIGDSGVIDGGAADGNTQINFFGGKSFILKTGGAERARIDSSGRLLVGTSSSRGNNFNTTGQDLRFQVEGTDYLASGASFTCNSNSATDGPHIALNRTRGAAVGSNTVVQNGDRLGLIAFQGNDGSEFVVGATIDALVDGTPGTNDMPSRLVFSTTADGASSPTERLRITSAGLVGIGTSAPSQLLHVSGGNILISNAYYLSARNNANTLSLSLIGRDTSDNVIIDPDGYGTKIGSASTLVTTSAGRVGIGTTSPGTALEVNGAAKANYAIASGPLAAYASSSGGLYSYFASTAGTINAVTDNSGTAGTLVFATGTERARIDSSGRILVGTSSARANFFNSTVTGDLQVESAGNGILSVIRNSNDAFAGAFVVGKSRGTAVGSNTVIQSGDGIGVLSFQGNDGTEFVEGARIQAVIDGTPGANDLPTRLEFSTTADGASSPTERMRISNTGVINTFNASGDSLNVRSGVAAGTSSGLIYGLHSATGTGNGTTSFIVWTNGNVVNTNNSYGAISDIKLKENIVDASSQWDDIKALQVRKYNFKEGQTHTQIGLVAQEVELVSPGLVSESPDRDAEGNDLGTVTKSVNYSVLYMKAVKALQEAMERIEQLEAAVATLQGQ